MPTRSDRKSRRPVRIALLRGINVGRAKRIAMADLRSLIEDLGFSDVRTLLNSGNAVFRTTRRSNSKIASSLEEAIASEFGFDVPVVVLSGDELNAIIAANPLQSAVREPSKFLVAFVNSSATLVKETRCPLSSGCASSGLPRRGTGRCTLATRKTLPSSEVSA